MASPPATSNALWRTLALALALPLLLLRPDPVMAVEEPRYVVERAAGAVEIRNYPELVVAEARVSGPADKATSEGFRELAGYIFGKNAVRQKIAMTAPVALEPAAGSQSMDATGDWVVRFVMPSSLALTALPAPASSRVTLKRLEGGRFAVMKFSGVASPKTAADRTSALQAWLRAEHLEPDGPPALAQYDPPWTLWFMRRNEIIQRLR